MPELKLLKIQNISKNYPGSDGSQIQVLKNLDLSFDAGSIHAVVGPSGCGKSTLLMLCGALIHPDNGTITVAGENLLALSAGECAARRGELIGFVFQQFHLIPYLNIEQNIMATCLAKPVQNGKERCDELIERLGLNHRRGHIPARLSAGEQQRVALGRALMNKPRLLIADEPTGNLDSENAEQLLELLKEFAKEEALVLMATHDKNIAQKADKILYL